MDGETPLRLLVAWHPNASGNEALEFAAWLSRTTPTIVRTATIVVRPWLALSKLTSKYEKQLAKEAHRACQQAKKALTAAGVPEDSWDDPVNVLVDGSSQAALLNDIATDFDASIILFGSQGAARKGSFRANSTVDALLHSSPYALGLTPRAPKLAKHGVKRLTVAFTSLEFDSDTLDTALGLAGRLDVPVRVLAILGEDVDTPTSLQSELHHSSREDALAFLDSLHDSIADKHPEQTVEAELAYGPSVADAMETPRWKKGDLLLIGSTPIGTLERVFVGSTAGEILRNIKTPAIVIPAGKPE
ncbi:universal stress protein [Corynebacterium pyruviciproducens]|uniref:universal stress protein n=1 Tax=Corynebacterium pyruviciproducens TaxID=598660 RepID=UPI002458C83A|nr:universal stress protein [Corynebacterium pyruviciproducens]MDH4658089.1 universal stress protein [Corynebacterium pyruviciproducens]